jgi:hypothetical protein
MDTRRLSPDQIERRWPILASRRSEREGFLRPACCGNVCLMDTTRLLYFLFALLITMGLAIAPLAAPAATGRAVSEASMQMAEMSGEMPCCPEKQKQSDCQDCPWLAICMAKVLQSQPSSDGLPVHGIRSRPLRPLDERIVAGLTRPPPDHPPRTIV